MSKSFEQLVARWKAAKAAFDKAEAEKEEALRDLRAACPHQLVSECPHQTSEYSAIKSPGRVCEVCGTLEWSWSFEVLTADRQRHVSRDEVVRIAHSF